MNFGTLGKGLAFPILLVQLGGCARASAPQTDAEIKLLVYLVVDQLRPDLLDRYADVFTGGFARLRTEGYRFDHATYDHAHTATAPGHATLVTGVHPDRHGVIANSWWEPDEKGVWRWVDGFSDARARIVGARAMEGRGPARLKRTGLPDWIADRHPEARIVSLAGKDRSAVAMAGHVRGEVYWMDEQRGRFLTSSYYRAAYPEWVRHFHSVQLPAIWSDTVWESTIPEWARGLSRPDTSAFEADGVHTYFPHRAALQARGADRRALNEWRSAGPYPDLATLALARVAVAELELGRRGSLDYLALSLSQLDRIGHDYGPRSREQFDHLVRLDRELGAFLEFLDATVGKDRWVLALTADHGAMELPESRADLGLYGRRITPEELAAAIARAEAAGNAAGEDPLHIARAAAAALMAEDWIADAFAWDDLLATEPADSLRMFFRRSWYPRRVVAPFGHLGVGVRLVEGVITRYPTGTAHGSPYLYDRHVPVILLVPGLAPGVHAERISMADLPVTLARLLGVPFPDDLDGRPAAVHLAPAAR